VYIMQNPPPSLEHPHVPNPAQRKFSQGFKDFVKLCLQTEPKKRPTAAKLLRHKFFNQVPKTYDDLKEILLKDLPSLGERFQYQQEQKKAKIKERETGMSKLKQQAAAAKEKNDKLAPEKSDKSEKSEKSRPGRSKSTGEKRKSEKSKVREEGTTKHRKPEADGDKDRKAEPEKEKKEKKKDTDEEISGSDEVLDFWTTSAVRISTRRENRKFTVEL